MEGNSIVLLAILGFLATEFFTGTSYSPVQCDRDTSICTVSNHLGVWPDRKPCKVARILYPRTEEDIIAAVSHATQHNMSMKVVSRWSQSIPMLVCPAGEYGILLSTRDLNTYIGVDYEAMTVTADAGVLLRDLVDEVARHGFAIPSATYWDAISLGGAVSTGAHGSRLLGTGSALHDHLVGMTLVVPGNEEDSYVRVIDVVEGDCFMEAARISLGVLGVISKLTFKIEPMFKRSVSLHVMDDEGIEDRVVEFGTEYEFGDICWHPSLKKALFRMDTRVPVDTPGEGVNKYSGFQPTPISRIQQIRLTEEKMEENRDNESLCKLSEMVLSIRVPSGNGFLNDGVKFTGFPVIGFNNLMQTAGGCYTSKQRFKQEHSCTFNEEEGASELTPPSETCTWDPRVNGSFYHQIAFAVGLSKVKDLILDIKKLRDMDPQSMCGLSLYGGVYLRYVKKSSAYLGQKEDAVEFDITFFRSRDYRSPRINEDVIEEIEQMALVKYEGKPHWGKNRNSAFVSVKDRVNDIERFIKVKNELDPKGIFSSEWSEAVLHGEKDAVLSMHDYCALEGMCVCSEDRHCAPDRGYFCRPGKVFKAARVCRYEQSRSIM